MIVGNTRCEETRELFNFNFYDVPSPKKSDTVQQHSGIPRDLFSKRTPLLLLKIAVQ